MTMSQDLLTRVLPRIQADFKFKQSEDGQWLNQGKCPACSKHSLFTHADNPWVLRCGRETKCGGEYEIKSLYPEEFGHYNKRFAPTPENPTATADAYMQEARGFPLSRVKGFYTQENFWHPKGNHGTATVRFHLPQSASYMERFVETVEVTEDDGTKTQRKQNFNGTHRGLWWQPPGMTINKGDTVWISEAIIDSISLYMMGIKSVAILSCSNYPETKLKEYEHHAVNWVIALDNDSAGKKHTLKLAKKMKAGGYSIAAAQVPGKSKEDWNDLYKQNKLTEENIDNYLYLGSLLIANDINEKCALIRKRSNVSTFITDFNNRMYNFSIKDEDYRAALRAETSIEAGDIQEIEPQASDEEILSAIKTAGRPKQIVNARIEFLYFQHNEVTDESLFYAAINYPDGRPTVNLLFSPGQVTAPAEFKKRLAHAQGAWFSGDAKNLDWMGERWLSNLKAVKTIDYIGYSKEFDTYIFPCVAVQGSRMYEINSEDYFDMPKLSVKSLARQTPMKLETSPRNYRDNWAQSVYTAFGTDGIVAATFWFASLFAEQIRAKHASFPFLEIIGEPGSGKTTLVEFLWRLFGRNEEGTDPNKNSFVANQRKLTQYANMPIVFIEADREEDSHAKRFDWDEVKPYYNGRGLRARGVKNNGNETYEPTFRGTLVIEQNAPVNASQAVLERIVQLKFTKAHHCAASKIATDEMSSMTMEDLSYFVIKATMQQRQIVDYVIEKAPKYQKALLQNEDINHARLALNHGQLIAFAEQFAELVSLTDAQKKETVDALLVACITREEAIARDHPVVAEFWDTFNFLNTKTNDATRDLLDHSSDPRTIAVNLNEYIESAGHSRQHTPPLTELKRHLKTSKRYKFIEASKAVASNIHLTKTRCKKTVRCWMFELPKGTTKVQRVENE